MFVFNMSSFPPGRKNGALLFTMFRKSGLNFPRSRLSYVITVVESWIHHYNP